MGIFGKQQVATEAHCKAPWGGRKNGERFRCSLCGHKFLVGDMFRMVYTNDIPKTDGNPLVCSECDGTDEEVRQKWREMCELAHTKFWYFCCDSCYQ